MIINSEHPALAGHFPGNPIVPGVILIDEVVAAFRLFIGKAVNIVAMPNIKFASPLLPEKEFEISFEQKKEGLVSFVMQSSGVIIMTGQLRHTV